MTNEEIRNKKHTVKCVCPCHNGVDLIHFAPCCSHNGYNEVPLTANQIQDLTRADERDRVIGEIEWLVNEAKAKDMKEQFGLNTMVVLAVIQAKLNSLKENK